MDEYYLVPHFEKMAPRDLYLLAFYKDRLSVSDGLMYWKFIEYKLPLLSYLSRNDQSQALFDVLQRAPTNADTLNAYRQLIDAEILSHCWLAGNSWDLQSKRNDNAIERGAIGTFNGRIRLKRNEIADTIHRYWSGEGAVSSSDAIKSAREEVGLKLIREIVDELAMDSDGSASVARKLRRRFNEHLKSYVRSEKNADSWLSKRNEGNFSYAGYLADIANDVQNNPQLFPIFASPEFTTFWNDMQTGGSRVSRTVREAVNGDRLAFESLARLPNVGFQGIDEVMSMREKLGEELANYNSRMHSLARRITHDPMTEEAESEIREIINSEVHPAVKELKYRTKQAKGEFKPWQLVSSAAYVSGLGVSFALGAPLPVLLGLGLGSVGQLAGLAGSHRSAASKQEELRVDQRFFGLSVVLDIQEKG